MSLKHLKTDLASFCIDGSKFSKIKVLFISHSFHLVFLIRLGQSFSELPIFGVFFRVMIEYIIRVIFASDISCKSVIGPGLNIQHGHDIVIGADVLIGKYCKIFNGVTLGNKDTTKSSKNNQPKIGDYVTLGSGSKILGPILIDDNSIVGANSVVLNDFGKGSIIVGVPAINKKRGLDEKK